jgi:hypothetical protein
MKQSLIANPKAIFAAALRERFAKRAVLEKQVNANLGGMVYGR